MGLKIKKIRNVPHFIVEVEGVIQEEESVQGVVICSDKKIEVTARNSKNKIIVRLTDEDSPCDLNKNPEIIAINANPSLVISKIITSKKEMEITIS